MGIKVGLEVVEWFPSTPGILSHRATSSFSKSHLVCRSLEWARVWDVVVGPPPPVSNVKKISQWVSSEVSQYIKLSLTDVIGL